MQDSAPDSRLRVGVIGLGYWGPNLLRNLATHPSIRLAYLCDLSAAALARVSGLAPEGCVRTTDPARLLADPQLDAVAIATPAATHYPLAKQALASGRHVLCEKPLALKSSEAEELCVLAARAGRVLMVGHTFLFNNSVLKVKELLSEGRLGRIYYATASRTHLGPVRRDASVVWDLASHDVAIMNCLFGGKPERVSAVGSRPLSKEHEDVAFLSLSYPGGILGHVQVSWLDSHKERTVAVIGEKARVFFNDLDQMEPVRIFEKGIGIDDSIVSFGEFQFLLRDGDIISPRVKCREPLGNLVSSFVETIVRGAANPTDGRFSLEVVRTLEAADRSIRAGGAAEDV